MISLSIANWNKKQTHFVLFIIPICNYTIFIANLFEFVAILHKNNKNRLSSQYSDVLSQSYFYVKHWIVLPLYISLYIDHLYQSLSTIKVDNIISLCALICLILIWFISFNTFFGTRINIQPIVIFECIISNMLTDIFWNLQTIKPGDAILSIPIF